MGTIRSSVFGFHCMSGLFLNEDDRQLEADVVPGQVFHLALRMPVKRIDMNSRRSASVGGHTGRCQELGRRRDRHGDAR
jgi:hypothetical protein